MMASNVHEWTGRIRKVERSIAFIDRLCRRSGINPHSPHGIHVIRNMLDNYTEERWGMLALNVGGSPASVHSRNLIKDHYRRRAGEKV